MADTPVAALDQAFRMDPAGARALAQRLAEGKVQDEMTLDGRLAVEARSVKSSPAEPPEAPHPLEMEEGVVYIRPARRSAQQDVWIYVRASDGRLRRAR
jgi:hypothetical protein